MNKNSSSCHSDNKYSSSGKFDGHINNKEITDLGIDNKEDIFKIESDNLDKFYEKFYT